MLGKFESSMRFNNNTRMPVDGMSTSAIWVLRVSATMPAHIECISESILESATATFLGHACSVPITLLLLCYVVNCLFYFGSLFTKQVFKDFRSCKDLLFLERLSDNLQPNRMTIHSFRII